MAYADYEYYTAAYLGTAIQMADFPRLSLRASSFLDYYTQGRAAQNKELDAVKMACCAVAEQYQSIDLAQQAALNALKNSANAGETGELQSQSVGSWSKTYRSGGDSAQQALSSAQAAQASLGAIAQQYLGATGLLYRGRGCGYGYVPPYCDALQCVGGD